MKITNWYTGVVECTNDPLQLGRVQVRCMGFHTPDLTLLPMADLPWASVILPTTSASICGIGLNHAMVAGTWVFGFFRDTELQDPVVIGTMAGVSPITGYVNNGGKPSTIGFQDPMGTYPLTSGQDAPGGSYMGSSNSGQANAQQNSLSLVDVYNGKGNGINATGMTGPGGLPAPTVNGSASAVANAGLGEIGVIETSNNQGEGIAKYWTATTYPGGYGDRASWCAAFVCWCVQKSDILPDKNRPKTASAFGLETEWARSNPSLVQIIKNPREGQPGDIVIYSFSHAAIITKVTDKGYEIIQGNSPKNGVEGVNLKDTSISSIKTLLRIKPSSTATA